MLNRRILRIKVFKVLYSYAENHGMTANEALDAFRDSCEATRDLYLFLLGIIPPLTDVARRRIEASRGKFSATEEDLHPNMKFASNALSALLEQDPDFQKLLQRKGLSWDQSDVLLHDLFQSISEKDYYRAYMDSPGTTSSLDQDVRLFKKIFENELEDNEALAALLEDMNILWIDEPGYALNYVIKSLDEIRRTGRWTLPPLYQSDILKAKGAEADSDEDFSRKLLLAAFSGFNGYYDKISSRVTKWDRERIYTTDIVLIAMGLAEAETFPEIPVKVTINEYVEISKYYSTPKSRVFVNGLLDSLIRESEAEGKVVKTGKGLL